MQATVAPSAAKAAAISAGSLVTVTGAGLDAGDLEEVLGEHRPRRERRRRCRSVARNTAGRVPAAAAASTRERRFSMCSTHRGPLEILALRDRRRPAAWLARTTAGTGSAMFGNSVTPVIGAVRRLMSVSRFARTAAMRSLTTPASTAARNPPACSTSWNTSHAASARSAVSCSTYHEPPAGSITSARCDSIASTDCVLRATRRPSSRAVGAS